MNTNYSDLELIYLIKQDEDPSIHLNELIERHSGIYLDIINTYRFILRELWKIKMKKISKV